jgi:succinate dehydrogenase / fumarate reductase iron-sulfur subunit
MASSEQVAGASAPVPEPSNQPPGRSRAVVQGRLPISELAYDRAGGPSPFGDDLQFPLPVEHLRYTHTTTA